MGRTAHSDLVEAILGTFGAMPGLRLWKQPVGVGVAPSGTHVNRYGIKGMADISGILAPNGRRVEIEVKTGTGRCSGEQRAWATMVAHHGGLYVEARRIEDVRKALYEAGTLVEKGLGDGGT